MNIDEILEKAKEGFIFNELTLIKLCQKAKEIFIEESNVELVNLPIVVCGDVHG